MGSIKSKKQYTTREAADLLQVTPETVKAYCRNGKLKGRQVGPKKQWMVPVEEIKKLQKEWNLD
jgi:excisionase family DNA binding protein